MLSKSATPAEIIAQETPQQLMENHPVIRTLYDHTDVSINCMYVLVLHSVLNHQNNHFICVSRR